jgi:hypothetical protein
MKPAYRFRKFQVHVFLQANNMKNLPPKYSYLINILIRDWADCSNGESLFELVNLLVLKSTQYSKIVFTVDLNLKARWDWPRAHISGRQTPGLTRVHPLLYNKCGGEPRVKPRVWRPEMWAQVKRRMENLHSCDMLYWLG